MIQRVNDLWPEDAYSLYDVALSQVTVAQNVYALLVPVNPLRTHLVISAQLVVATPLRIWPGFSQTQNQGVSIVNSQAFFAIGGPGWEVLAGQQWNASTTNAGGYVATMMELRLNRPAERLPSPSQIVPTKPANAGDLLRDYLQRASQWRSRAMDFLGTSNGITAQSAPGLRGLEISGPNRL